MNTEPLEEVIRKAVPESMECLLMGIGENEICHYCRAIDGGVDGCSTGRPLTLRDVLISAGVKDDHGTMYNEGQFDVLKIVSMYDLTKDYHDQSEELYSFLYSLLCKK